MVLECGKKQEIPTIDLRGSRSEVSKEIVKACEGFGFFKVINHGVSFDVIDELVDESCKFFAKPTTEKERGGPAKPYGYGSKTIGSSGDTGEVEYILLQANPLAVSTSAKTLSNDPTKFSTAVNDYIKAVKELACDLLDLMAEGLLVPDTSIFSRLIKDDDNDSVFRINHYPPLDDQKDQHILDHKTDKVGFGEHFDPQLLTVLRFNDVPGLQICVDDEVWIPVIPDPTAFFVNVGDILQVMTNGRFLSVRHRALVETNKTRTSIAYFASPPLNATITLLPNLQDQFPLYKEFTWSEYKMITYSLRLGDTRINFFRSNSSNVNFEQTSTSED